MGTAKRMRQSVEFAAMHRIGWKVFIDEVEMIERYSGMSSCCAAGAMRNGSMDQRRHSSTKEGKGPAHRSRKERRIAVEGQQKMVRWCSVC